MPRAFLRLVATLKQQPLWACVLVSTLASLVVCQRIATQALVVGSAAGGAVYDYRRPADSWTVTIFAIVSAAASAGLLWRSRQEDRRREWALVGFWLLLGTGLQALLRSLAPFGVETIFLAEGANSFYTVTQQHGAAAVLTDFNRLRHTWPLHAQSNMPGKIMLLYALELVSSRPSVLAWLVILASNVGAIFLYVFVRDLFADRRVALFSLVLYLFVPGKLFFFPLMNAVTPTVAFACAMLVGRCLQTGRLGHAVAAGVGLFGLVFFEPLPLVFGVLFAMLAARAVHRRDVTERRLVGLCAVGSLAFIASYLALRLSSGFDLLDTFRLVAGDASTFNAEAQRPYGMWVTQNLADFFFGVGVCQALLFWPALWDGLGSDAGARPVVDRPIVLVCAGAAIMLAAIDLTGVNRGEVIRLWIFLACLWQIPTASLCARLDSRTAVAIVVVMAVLQAALAGSMIGFVVP